MLRIAASLLLLCLAPAAWTAGPPKDKATWLDMRASELIGKHVANPEGRSLGKVEGLVVDLKGGHIPHVVLSFGGLADLGDKRFVFPVNAFTRDEQRDRIVLNVERSNWPFQPPLERVSKLRGKNVKAVRGVIVAQDGRKADEPKLTLPPGSLSLGKSE